MSPEIKEYATVALNGIPRGICNDFSVEEGWVQYWMPTDDNKYGTGPDPDTVYELRRYFGNVEVLGYWDPDGPSDQLMKHYDALPKDTPLIPAERYEVVPAES